jgi:hypothetical protein
MMSTRSTPHRPKRLTDVPKVEGYDWLTVRQLRRWVYERVIPSYRVGGFVILDLDDLDAMVAAGRRDPAA